MSVDTDTGELIEEETGDELVFLRNRVESLGEARQTVADDLARAERELRKLRRKVDELKAELDEQRQEADEMPIVKTIFQAWVRATGRNPKVTKLGPARQKAVLARLREGRNFEYVLRAATVGAQAAHVSDKEGERTALLAALREATSLLSDAQAQSVRALFREASKGVTRYDDLELICRNEVNLERFAALADRVDPEREAELPAV